MTPLQGPQYWPRQHIGLISLAIYAYQLMTITASVLNCCKLVILEERTSVTKRVTLQILWLLRAAPFQGLLIHPMLQHLPHCDGLDLVLLTNMHCVVR